MRLSDGQRVWRHDVGEMIRSSPVVYRDVAVLFGSDDGAIYALALHDGRLLWRWQTSGAVVADLTLAGDRLLAASIDRHLYALNLQWQEEVADER